MRPEQLLPWMRPLLFWLDLLGSVQHAAEKAGVGLKTIYKHKAKNPEFKRAYELHATRGIAARRVLIADMKKIGLRCRRRCKRAKVQHGYLEGF